MGAIRQQFRWYANLSGERLETAKRVTKQDAAVAIVLAVAAVSYGVSGHELTPKLSLTILAVLIAWQVVHMIRKETYTQLRLLELKDSKAKAKKSLEDLNDYAKATEQSRG